MFRRTNLESEKIIHILAHARTHQHLAAMARHTHRRHVPQLRAKAETYKLKRATGEMLAKHTTTEKKAMQIEYMLRLSVLDNIVPRQVVSVATNTDHHHPNPQAQSHLYAAFSIRLFVYLNPTSSAHRLQWTETDNREVARARKDVRTFKQQLKLDSLGDAGRQNRLQRRAYDEQEHV
ncbi:hypothetical protein B0O99DRAFT_594897 [Bisporella sp. PMI_857]|nr:hypothetical protein B0O99DRAFT_594897 [Bisporella sp. PMI_857]